LVKEVLHRILVGAVDGIEDVEVFGDYQRYPMPLESKAAPRIGMDDSRSGRWGNAAENKRNKLIIRREPSNFSIDAAPSESVNKTP
jgi:hypothetical protein